MKTEANRSEYRCVVRDGSGAVICYGAAHADEADEADEDGAKLAGERELKSLPTASYYDVERMTRATGRWEIVRLYQGPDEGTR